MPEMNENEVPTTPQTTKKHNERTEARYFEDVDKIIAEAERLGADYQPPNEIAKVVNLKAKRDAARAQRTAYQAAIAEKETVKNRRERLYQPLNSHLASLVAYVKSAGVPNNDLNALKSIAREVKGGRAQSIDPNDGARHISVANLSFASRADNYALFIEQYDALGIATNEDLYKTATQRAKLAAIRDANAGVIAAESNTDTASERLDRLAYLDNDCTLNGCISAKEYIKSKYKTVGQPYKNIAKTRFVLPSRLRKKK